MKFLVIRMNLLSLEEVPNHQRLICHRQTFSVTKPTTKFKEQVGYPCDRGNVPVTGMNLEEQIKYEQTPCQINKVHVKS